MNNSEILRLIESEDWEAFQGCLARGEWGANSPLGNPHTGETFQPLDVAVERGLVAICKQLIELGADVNARSRRGETALMTACDMGHQEIVEMLLKAGARADSKTAFTDEGDRGETPLMAAVCNGHMDIVRSLLDAGASVTATTRKGLTALSYAVNVTDINQELVRVLLERGCQVDGRDLHNPVYQRDLETVKLLLAKKPDVNRPYDWPAWLDSPKKGDTPLFVAVDNNAVEMIGPEWTEKKRAERLAIVDLLIETGVDVNAQRGTKGNGWTPLMLAAAVDEDEIARRLMDAGADPNKTVECSRITLIDGRQKQVKGPLSAVGMAQERPDNKKIRRLLLGHE